MGSSCSSAGRNELNRGF